MNPSDVGVEARRLLEDKCSFVFGVTPSGLSMLPSSDALTLVAGDGMGGCFHLWYARSVQGMPPVVYLSEYGETSRFADSLHDAFAIVASFPDEWGSLLVAANKGEASYRRVLEAVTSRNEPVEEATKSLESLLNLDLRHIPERFFAAVRRQPAFSPSLESVDGPTPAGSFAERPYPK